MRKIFTSPKEIARQIVADSANQSDQILVGIDGHYDAGKTTLALNLAYLLSAEHLKLDDFGSIEGQEDFAHSKDCERIAARMAEKGITIIEGVCLFHVAEHCKIEFARTVYVKCVGPNTVRQNEDECNPPLDYDGTRDNARYSIDHIRRYHADFRPHERADYIFERRA